MNEEQLRKIESTFGAKLPDEFKSYISNNPDTLAVNDLTWSSDPNLIKPVFVEGLKKTLKFDIKNNDYWPRVFGDRPESEEACVQQAMAYLEQLPPLLPINGLRNLMTSMVDNPNADLPILSFQQFTDTIYMYKNFEDFLNNKQLSDEELESLPRVTGWNKVFDGLGANDDELYLETAGE